MPPDPQPSLSEARLPRPFFARPTPLVARALLGAVLVRQLPTGEQLRGRVVETEAYHGPDDTGSHARAGRTSRTALMFGPAGHAYVYLIYGMHHMLNVTTDEPDFPGAVLIRALAPLAGLETMARLRGGSGRPHELTSGPGKLCRALNITRSLNGEDLVTSQSLWFERGAPIPDAQVGRSPRIGIPYAEPADRERPWRFFLEGNPWVSRPT